MTDMTFHRTRCPQCKGKLDPGQRIHPGCIEAWADAQEAKAQRKAAKQARMAAKVQRSEIAQRKQAIKTLPQLHREAQAAFNAFIRARDKGKPCICCGLPLSAGDVGGAYDCGHYRSVGSAPTCATTSATPMHSASSATAGGQGGRWITAWG